MVWLLIEHLVLACSVVYGPIAFICWPEFIFGFNFYLVLLDSFSLDYYVVRLDLGFVLVQFWLLIYCLTHLEVVSVFSDCCIVLVFIQFSVLVLVYVWFWFWIRVTFTLFRFCFRAVSFTVPLFGFSVPFSNVLILVCFVFRSG